MFINKLFNATFGVSVACYIIIANFMLAFVISAVLTIAGVL